MTPAQVRIIRAGFAQMEPTLPNFGHKYYGRVFAKAPELRALLEGREEQLAKAVCALIRRRASMALPALGDAAAGRPADAARQLRRCLARGRGQAGQTGRSGIAELR